jgi:hypothetical protein
MEHQVAMTHVLKRQLVPASLPCSAMFAPDFMPDDEDDVVHHQQVHRRNTDNGSMIKNMKA